MIRIGGFVRVSTVDWEDHVSMVVFLAGCNFNCPFCYNADIIPRTSGEIYDWDTWEATLDELYPKFVDSITFCGGEPTLQMVPLIRAIVAAKAKGLKIKVDTNGSNPIVIRRLVEGHMVDRIALDVKARPDEFTYNTVIGGTTVPRYLSRIHNTMKVTKTYDTELEVRTTVVPGLNDSKDGIVDIANFIKDYADIYYLQQYTNQGVTHPIFKTIESPSIDYLKGLAELAKLAGVKKVGVRPGTWVI